MKAGDLVRYKGNTTLWVGEDVWVVVDITGHKKTWHRKIILFNSGGIIAVSWADQECFEVINE